MVKDIRLGEAAMTKSNLLAFPAAKSNHDSAVWGSPLREARSSAVWGARRTWGDTETEILDPRALRRAA